ncbi:MAG: hypothetical protein KDK66_02775 [Deltaproteobacteria bacterium]|nr:hypothetical protein [Deltaproteobacteria bacterium]
MALDQIQLDLNNPVFQKGLFELQKTEQSAVLRALKKLSQMSWKQIYEDKGLHWEQIHSLHGKQGEKLYTFRISRAFRAVAYREENWMRILSLNPDHDSAYVS